MSHQIENAGNWLKIMVFALLYNGNAIKNLEANLESMRRENELLRKENEQLKANLK